MMRFPDQRFTAIILCNTPSADIPALTGAIAQIYVGDRMTSGSGSGRAGGLSAVPSPPSVVSASEGADYAGSYRSEELDAIYVFAPMRDILVMRRGGTIIQLRRLSPDVLSAGNLILRFTRDASRRVTGFTLDAGRVRGITFERLGGPG